MEYSNLFVCLMGMGIVFAGLLCLIALVSLMGRVCSKPQQTTSPLPSDSGESLNAEDKKKLLAAITAAIAEDSHADVSAVRIVSIRRV